MTGTLHNVVRPATPRIGRVGAACAARVGGVFAVTDVGAGIGATRGPFGRGAKNATSGAVGGLAPVHTRGDVGVGLKSCPVVAECLAPRLWLARVRSGVASAPVDGARAEHGHDHRNHPMSHAYQGAHDPQVVQANRKSLAATPLSPERRSSGHTGVRSPIGRGIRLAHLRRPADQDRSLRPCPEEEAEEMGACRQGCPPGGCYPCAYGLTDPEDDCRQQRRLE